MSTSGEIMTSNNPKRSKFPQYEAFVYPKISSVLPEATHFGILVGAFRSTIHACSHPHLARAEIDLFKNLFLDRGYVVEDIAAAYSRSVMRLHHLNTDGRAALLGLGEIAFGDLVKNSHIIKAIASKLRKRLELTPANLAHSNTCGKVCGVNAALNIIRQCFAALPTVLADTFLRILNSALLTSYASALKNPEESARITLRDEFWRRQPAATLPPPDRDLLDRLNKSEANLRGERIKCFLLTERRRLETMLLQQLVDLLKNDFKFELPQKSTKAQIVDAILERLPLPPELAPPSQQQPAPPRLPAPQPQHQQRADDREGIDPADIIVDFFGRMATVAAEMGTEGSSLIDHFFFKRRAEYSCTHGKRWRESHITCMLFEKRPDAEMEDPRWTLPDDTNFRDWIRDPRFSEDQPCIECVGGLPLGFAPAHIPTIRLKTYLCTAQNSRLDWNAANPIGKVIAANRAHFNKGACYHHSTAHSLPNGSFITANDRKVETQGTPFTSLDPRVVVFLNVSEGSIDFDSLPVSSISSSSAVSAIEEPEPVLGMGPEAGDRSVDGKSHVWTTKAVTQLALMFLRSSGQHLYDFIIPSPEWFQLFLLIKTTFRELLLSFASLPNLVSIRNYATTPRGREYS